MSTPTVAVVRALPDLDVARLRTADQDGNKWEVFAVTEAGADEGGPDCICHKDLERNFISSITAVASTHPAG
jgi:hypothetical protein